MNLVDVSFLWCERDLVDDLPAHSSKKTVIDEARDNAILVAIGGGQLAAQWLGEAAYGSDFAYLA